MATNEEVLDAELYDDVENWQDEETTLHRWVRIALSVLTLPWLAVFFVAIALLDPYPGGEPLRMGTHKQLGLPECSFKEITGIPCPSCGMTTSFALLMHGDMWNSMQANFAGTALATFGLLFVPWALASAFFGRFVFIKRLELVIFRLALIFLFLLFGRWGIVVIWQLLNPPGGGGP